MFGEVGDSGGRKRRRNFPPSPHLSLQIGNYCPYSDEEMLEREGFERELLSL
jgi:hypothetical protein